MFNSRLNLERENRFSPIFFLAKSTSRHFSERQKEIDTLIHLGIVQLAMSGRLIKVIFIGIMVILLLFAALEYLSNLLHGRVVEATFWICVAEIAVLAIIFTAHSAVYKTIDSIECPKKFTGSDILQIILLMSFLFLSSWFFTMAIIIILASTPGNATLPQNGDLNFSFGISVAFFSVSITIFVYNIYNGLILERKRRCERYEDDLRLARIDDSTKDLVRLINGLQQSNEKILQSIEEIKGKIDDVNKKNDQDCTRESKK